MSDKAYIKITVPPKVKEAANKNLEDLKGLTLTQWLRSKVFEASGTTEDKP